MKRKKLSVESEEFCGECGFVFGMKYSREDCPNCGKKVMACGCCDQLTCQKCNEGSKFREKLPLRYRRCDYAKV